MTTKEVLDLNLICTYLEYKYGWQEKEAEALFEAAKESRSTRDIMLLWYAEETIEYKESFYNLLLDLI